MHIVDLFEMDEALLDEIGERIRLAKILRIFAQKMAGKLMAHMNDKSGWDDEAYTAAMHDALRAALKDRDYVSVANYAMFLDALGYKPMKTS